MNVLTLSDYRKKPVEKQFLELPNSPRYFCLRCNSDSFKLYETGDVHCSHCGARIKNVRVSE